MIFTQEVMSKILDIKYNFNIKDLAPFLYTKINIITFYYIR